MTDLARCRWGTLRGRPVLFAVDARTAHEMLASLEVGEHPVAIVERAQVVGLSLE